MELLHVHPSYLLACVSALILAAYGIKVLSAPLSKIPGPWYSKWTGVVLTYHWVTGNRPIYVHGLHQVYGPIVRISPSEVDVTDAKAVKTIYAIRDGFGKSPWYSQIVPKPTENIFSTTDLDFHRRHRRLLGGTMSDSGLKGYLPAVTSRVELAISRMREELHQQGAVDILKWWMFMTTDIIGELTFGESFNTLEQAKKSQYTHDLEAMVTIDAIRSAFPTLGAIAAHLPIPIFTAAVKAHRRVMGYADESIHRYYNLLASDPTRAKLTVFTKVFQAKEEETLTFREMRNDAAAFIIAGSDTTANTLTYAIWSICRHPQVKARLMEELRKLPDDYTDEHLRTLPYLSQVIEETLRVYSVVGTGLPREVPASGASLCGYWLPPRSTVCAQSYSMHQDPVAFPNPGEFRPERWEKSTKEMKDAMMAFGLGSRVCLGMHLAYLELRLGIAKFFLEFPEAVMSFKDGMSDADMIPERYFLTSPKGKRCLIEA